MLPQIGEYWYIVHTLTNIYNPLLKRNVVSLVRIESIVKDCVIVKYDNELLSLRKENCLSKWKPNLFWKMLGYK